MKELEEKIEYLEARIEELEKKERRRTIWTNVKRIFKLVIILLAIGGLYYGYRYVRYQLPDVLKDYVTEQLPGMVEEAVSDKTSKIKDGISGLFK